MEERNEIVGLTLLSSSTLSRSISSVKVPPRKLCTLTPEHRHQLLLAVAASVRQLKDFYTVDCAQGEASASSFLDLIEGALWGLGRGCQAHPTDLLQAS